MRNYFKPAVFLLSLWPIYIITYQLFYNKLGPEPVDRIINHFGEWTLIFILFTLSMTPLRKITKSLEWIKFRRMLGLFAFFYASIHMLSYVGLDYRFDFEPLINDVLKNKILKNIRCLICQGQSVYDSESEFASSIKLIVDRKINEGLKEKQIYQFLREKYGDWVIFDPQLNKNTYVLWLLPLLLFFFGGAILYKKIQKKNEK